MERKRKERERVIDKKRKEREAVRERKGGR